LADKPLRWMLDTLQTPPVGRESRVEAGVLLRRIQRGESVGMPTRRVIDLCKKRLGDYDRG